MARATTRRPAPRWLDPAEMRAWRNLLDLMAELQLDLEADLLADQHLSMGDYQVLVYLSESEQRALRMCDLAQRLQLSPSGLTRRLDGLVRDGLVERRPSPDDRRVILARLTEAGYRRIAEAAPDHVAHVRRHLFDHLEPGETEQLGVLLEKLRTSRAARPD